MASPPCDLVRLLLCMTQLDALQLQRSRPLLLAVVCRWRGSPESAGLRPPPRVVFTHCKFDSQLGCPGEEPSTFSQSRTQHLVRGPKHDSQSEASDFKRYWAGVTGRTLILPKICCPACMPLLPIPVLVQSEQGTGLTDALEPAWDMARQWQDETTFERTVTSCHRFCLPPP